jgi:predicted acylesterase/phospholipase RssA
MIWVDTLRSDYKMQDMQEHTADTQLEALPYCDVVMKGGITSGVVYPLAIRELANKFRLNNIGGTSAGAVAAAIAAAAEYRRQKDGVKDAYIIMEEIPKTMSKDLLTLFQPTPQMRPLFEMLIAAQKGKSTPGKLGRAVLAGVREYPLATGAGLLVGLALPQMALAMGLKLGVGLRVLLPVLGGGTGLSARMIHAINKELPANGFGMCTGLKQPGYTKPALTDWLTDTIDRAAGRGVSGDPLTFGDLIGNDQTKPLVNLQVMTTNLSMRRPYRLPFETGIYVFRRRDFARLFPKRVLDYIMKSVRPYPGYKPYLMAGESRADKENAVIIEGVKDIGSGKPLRFHIFDDQKKMIVDKKEEDLVDVDEELAALKAKLKQLWDKRDDLNEFEKHELVQSVTSMLGHTPKNGPQQEDYYYFPDKEHVPVVVAARMSLSFPGLISAVPLYAVDYTKEESAAKKKLEVCWFSDGGLSSNFPIHLFDRLLPESPTFGIALEPYDSERHGNDLVQMPVKAGEGIVLPIYPINGLGSFVMTILNTAKDWQDNLQSSLPGYRERIVHLALKEEEGGLNLSMPRATIEQLSARGADAGKEAVRQFGTPAHPDKEPDKNFDLNDHRWRRFLIAMANLEETLTDLGNAYTSVSFQEFLNELQEGERDASYFNRTKDIEWLKRARARAQELADLGKEQRVFDRNIPKPDTEFRIVPSDVG